MRKVEIYWHTELEAWVYDVPGQGCAKAADLIARPPSDVRQSVEGICDLCGRPMPPHPRRPTVASEPVTWEQEE